MHEPDSSESLKPYFRVPRPAHFRVRPDLVEELDVPDLMPRTLPQDETAYRLWLGWSGFATELVPFSSVWCWADERYVPTPRYVLKSPVFPGRLRHNNVVTDGHYWVCHAEPGGLFDFVFLRAVEFCRASGMSDDDAMRRLRAGPLHQGRKESLQPAWAVGYEPRTGLCTLLDIEHPETERLFLEGRAGYQTPFHEPL